MGNSAGGNKNCEGCIASGSGQPGKRCIMQVPCANGPTEPLVDSVGADTGGGANPGGLGLEATADAAQGEENKLAVADGEAYEEATRVYVDGSTYTGQMRGGLRDGQGVWLAPAVQYEGQWLGDLQQGKGELSWADGRAYVGQFHQGKFHGQGRMVWNTPKGLLIYEGPPSWLSDRVGELKKKIGLAALLEPNLIETEEAPVAGSTVATPPMGSSRTAAVAVRLSPTLVSAMLQREDDLRLSVLVQSAYAASRSHDEFIRVTEAVQNQVAREFGFEEATAIDAAIEAMRGCEALWPEHARKFRSISHYRKYNRARHGELSRGDAVPDVRLGSLVPPAVPAAEPPLLTELQAHSGVHHEETDRAHEKMMPERMRRALARREKKQRDEAKAAARDAARAAETVTAMAAGADDAADTSLSAVLGESATSGLPTLLVAGSYS